jgi:hypothetical protein
MKMMVVMSMVMMIMAMMIITIIITGVCECTLLTRDELVTM